MKSWCCLVRSLTVPTKIRLLRHHFTWGEEIITFLRLIREVYLLSWDIAFNKNNFCIFLSSSACCLALSLFLILTSFLHILIINWLSIWVYLLSRNPALQGNGSLWPTLQLLSFKALMLRFRFLKSSYGLDPTIFQNFTPVWATQGVKKITKNSTSNVGLSY